MPIYDYKCGNNHTVEIAHSIREEPEVLCPQCGNTMTRTPQTTTIKFNGSGWASKDG